MINVFCLPIRLLSKEEVNFFSGVVFILSDDLLPISPFNKGDLKAEVLPLLATVVPDVLVVSDPVIDPVIDDVILGGSDPG